PGGLGALDPLLHLGARRARQGRPDRKQGCNRGQKHNRRRSERNTSTVHQGPLPSDATDTFPRATISPSPKGVKHSTKTDFFTSYPQGGWALFSHYPTGMRDPT